MLNEEEIRNWDIESFDAFKERKVAEFDKAETREEVAEILGVDAAHLSARMSMANIMGGMEMMALIMEVELAVAYSNDVLAAMSEEESEGTE